MISGGIARESIAFTRFTGGRQGAHTFDRAPRRLPGLFCHHCRRADEVLNSSAPKLPNLGFSPVPTLLRTTAQGQFERFTPSWLSDRNGFLRRPSPAQERPTARRRKQASPAHGDCTYRSTEGVGALHGDCRHRGIDRRVALCRIQQVTQLRIAGILMAHNRSTAVQVSGFGKEPGRGWPGQARHDDREPLALVHPHPRGGGEA